MFFRRPFQRTPTKSQTLTKAFEEITGIKVNHQLLGEGEVVQAYRPRCRPAGTSTTDTSMIPT